VTDRQTDGRTDRQTELALAITRSNSNRRALKFYEDLTLPVRCSQILSVNSEVLGHKHH